MKEPEKKCHPSLIETKSSCDILKINDLAITIKQVNMTSQGISNVGDIYIYI